MMRNILQDLKNEFDRSVEQLICYEKLENTIVLTQYL